MAVVRVDLAPRGYDVTIEPGALERLGELTRACAPHARCALGLDASVTRPWGEQACRSLELAGYAVAEIPLDPGEKHKSLATVQRIYDVLLEQRLERTSPVIALGGGVIGDTVGFAAATYLRGVPFVQCPTTLLAMVDASIGGKVGINVPQGKNLVGAFHQPVAVLADPRVLQSLPDRELRCGLAECIKHGLISDPGLLDFIAAQLPSLEARDPEVLGELVRRNVEIKADIVMRDERESGVRAHLNFGHTFGHAIETSVGYGEILHGEAVGLGMISACVVAERMGLCDAALVERVRGLLASAGLMISAELPDDDALWSAMQHDKKAAGDRIRFVLPERAGHVIIRDDVGPEELRAAWSAIRA